MVKSYLLAAVAALASSVNAQCGSGSPAARVTGSGSSFTAVLGSSTIYTGSDYRLAIQTAIDRISSGQRVVVAASGSIGANTLTIGAGKTFEGCGTINAASRNGRGAIEVTDVAGVKIPFLTMTGNPYFGLRFSGTRDLELGQINLNFNGGMGIRFDRDRAANSNVRMGTITCRGTGSHCVETWNINGLEIDSVVARDVGECGLLIQNSVNVNVGLVDGQNVAAGNGYATLRFANQNGRLNNGYSTNVRIDSVRARGGGRGIFCVSESGGAEIGSVDIADMENNAILIENCYGVTIRGGTVVRSGEVRIAARTEFANTRDTSITLRVDGAVRESPCADNSVWNLSGSGSRNIC
ncbi:hypothetical protein BS50DRAFT_576316 [Corynespora cassiicola Philippines]|uniref:Parallel beta-helix repeat protein n=1 Tax=Corynespora cassiicola Philippines TaxID=1448308 RepID=A0A2T2NE80_CORCC|nr:hypothetical protein BS50DRAFT_576316 [Corynespora cassiicola Philippines]